MYTNLNNKHGTEFRNALNFQLINAQSVRIASGYMSLQTISVYKNELIKIAKQNHGNVQLMLGMAFYEGLSKKQNDACLELHELLSRYPNSGVYVTYGRRYHGKVYEINNDQKTTIFVGSSNFSPSGLSGNIECTIEIIDEFQKYQISSFLTYLFSKYSKKINEVFINTGNKKTVTDSIMNKYRQLSKHNETIDFSLPTINIDLARIAEKEQSNLNVYFGRGRENKSNGKIIPRPWYEIEIISPKEISLSPIYPKGNFLAYTDDGLIIPMRTQGDYNKNLRSRDSLQIFGMWLKGKLEKSGALRKYEPVTLNTLLEYGSTDLKLLKINDGKYFMIF
jgi:hypothetical protein